MRKLDKAAAGNVAVEADPPPLLAEADITSEKRSIYILLDQGACFPVLELQLIFLVATRNSALLCLAITQPF